jgi:hypothetical protein
VIRNITYRALSSFGVETWSAAFKIMKSCDEEARLNFPLTVKLLDVFGPFIDSNGINDENGLATILLTAILTAVEMDLNKLS